MNGKGKELRLGLTVIFVLFSEIASFWHLQDALSWSHGFLGPIVAAAVIGLLIATIVGATLSPSPTMSRLLFTGGAWLLLVQALGVVSSTAITAEASLPADEIGRFWGVSPGVVWRVSSLISGGTLSLVTFAFWHPLAKSFNELAEDEEKAKEDFDNELERVTQFRRKQ